MNHNRIKLLILTIISLTGMAMTINYSSLGKCPKGVHLSRIKKSQNYNIEKKKFVNRRAGLVEENLKFNFDVIKEWFKERNDLVPTKKLPEIMSDFNSQTANLEQIRAAWFGHSSILLQILGKYILIDPVFSNAASPISFFVKRFQDPVIQLHELPEIDYILISHDHYDHLDYETIKFFRDKKTEFIVPLGVSSHLTDWEIDPSRITELDWWEKETKEDIEFIATPSQHFSGRTFSQRDKSLWASWIIRNKTKNIYYSGDSGYDIHFKEIGKKYGPFDLAFIESGQYNEKWKEVHMLPHQSVQTYFDLKAKLFIPIHWGMFRLAFHPWFEPVQKLSEQAKIGKINLIVPKLGQIITTDSSNQNISDWWNPN